MQNATIQINQGQIRAIDKREPNPLSLSKVEELLHGYFRQRGGKDETMDVMTYIRANRGYTVSKSLKQSGTVNNGGRSANAAAVAAASTPSGYLP